MSGTTTSVVPNKARTIHLNGADQWANKSPAATLDYWIDCTDEIGSDGGNVTVSIVAATLSIIAGDGALVMPAGTTNAPNPVIQFGMVGWLLAGGTPGTTYSLLATVVLLSGTLQRTCVRQISLTMTSTPASVTAIAGAQMLSIIGPPGDPGPPGPPGSDGVVGPGSDISSTVVIANGATQTMTQLAGSLSSSIAETGTLSNTLGSIAGTTGMLVGEFGTFQTTVGSLQATTGTLATSVSTLTGSLTNVSGSVTSLSGTLGTLSGTVGTLSTSLTTASGSITSLSGSLGTLSGSVGTLQGSVSGLQTQTGTLGTQVGTLNTSVGSLTGTITGLSATVGALSGQFGTFSTTVASTTGAGLAKAKSGGIISFDTAGVADINTGSPNLVTGSAGPAFTPASADIPYIIADLLRLILPISLFGQIGNSTTGDDLAFNAAIAAAQNAVTNSVTGASSWGTKAKGQCARILFPPGCNVYLAAGFTISGAITLESGGKSTSRIIPLNPATTRVFMTDAMDGANGNNYSSGSAPKGVIRYRGFELSNAGNGNVGLYGNDPLDSTGLKQMSCPYFTDIPNDQSVTNTGKFTIGWINGEVGPICSVNLPPGRYRIDFTGPATYVVTLLYVQNGMRVTNTATGTVGSQCTVYDATGTIWLCKMVVTSTVASVAGDIAYFINGITAIYCTNPANGDTPLKPFIEFEDFQIYAFGGCGIAADPNWSGQIRGYPGCVIKSCGADALFGVTLYDGSFQNWEIALNGRGVSLFKCATNKFLFDNIYSNIWNNVYIVGGGSTGPIEFHFAEVDHCARGHAVYLNCGGGNVIHLHLCNGNVTGLSEPNLWCTFWIGAQTGAGKVAIYSSADQSCYSNSVTAFFSSITASASSNSTTLVLTDASGVQNGMWVAGQGIPVGTTVASAPSGNTVTLSLPATVPSGVSISFINATQTALASIGFENITSTLQVDATVANSFLDSPPLWGQCVAGSGAGSTPIFLQNPNVATTAAASSSSSTTLLVSGPGPVAGMTAIGAGIPAQTGVQSAVFSPSMNVTTVTLSAAASVTIGAAVTFQPISPPISLATSGSSSISGSGGAATTTVTVPATTGLANGVVVNGPGVPIGAQVTAFAGTSVTFSGAGNIAPGSVLTFQARTLPYAPAGVNWGTNAPRQALATVVLGRHVAQMWSVLPGGMDGFYGFANYLAKSASSGPLATVYDYTNSGIPVTYSIDGQSTGGVAVCQVGGGAFQIGGPVQFQALGTGIIVGNGSLSATIIAAPGAEAVSGSTASTTLAVLPGLHAITGTSAGPVSVQFPPAAQMIAKGLVGRLQVLKDVDGNAGTNNITATAAGATSFIIAGPPVASLAITTNGASLGVIFDGTNLHVVF